ncbi:hypothetical protein FIBSPDRAFT_965121 [Athelia psychrophila]|uniref:Cysteine proteinase n=1 Tax=Athelia psychrophila TaxID=1759441 RepID=A0A165WZ67_9AGAM|nr:hypothetical protein FIBSPDRAFT_965121 [Fibularhizoctonia sp. CBS 109695]
MVGGSITDGLDSSIDGSPNLTLAQTILQHFNTSDALQSRTSPGPTPLALKFSFTSGPVTNQKSSRRCWLCATMNVLQLKEFELSHGYPFFYDKLNKANY